MISIDYNELKTFLKNNKNYLFFKKDLKKFKKNFYNTFIGNCNIVKINIKYNKNKDFLSLRFKKNKDFKKIPNIKIVLDNGVSINAYDISISNFNSNLFKIALMKS